VRDELRAADGREAGTPAREGDSVLRVARLSIDLRTRTAIHRGRSVRLGVRECAALQALIEAGGRVVQPQVILDRVWGASSPVEAARVRGVIRRLRVKLRPADLIETIGREGYRLAVTD
jgi:DNA-binding response OmpR family regulator